MGYCYYTQLLSKCRKLEDKRRRTCVSLVDTGKSRTDGDFAVDAAVTGCSSNNEEVEENKVCSVFLPVFSATACPQARDLEVDMRRSA